MPQSLYKIYVHIVFSTKYRQPLIDDAIKPELFAYLAGACNALNCRPVSVGGYDDHVHILCTLSKNLPLMKLLAEIKANSSKWMKTQGPYYSNFFWQEGYGAFSVSHKQLDKVVHYIENQVEYHRKTTYQAEFISLLQKHQIEYDERYLWD